MQVTTSRRMVGSTGKPLTGAAKKAAEAKAQRDADQVAAIGAPAAVPAPTPTVSARSWGFVARRGMHTGKNMILRLRGGDDASTAALVAANSGSAYLRFRNWRLSTAAPVIRDWLRAEIKAGRLIGVQEDVQVKLRCDVAGCAFRTNLPGPAGLAELQDHFLAAHAGTDDEDEEG